MKRNSKETSSIITPSFLGAAGPAQQVWDGRLLDGEHQVTRAFLSIAQMSLAVFFISPTHGPRVFFDLLRKRYSQPC
jgi:hypothetical protein